MGSGLRGSSQATRPSTVGLGVWVCPASPILRHNSNWVTPRMGVAVPAPHHGTRASHVEGPGVITLQATPDQARRTGP